MLLLSKLSKLFRRTRKEALTQRAPSFEGLEGRTLFNVVTPAPPTNLTVNAASSTSASLHWSDNSTRESGYDIERSTDGKTFSQIKVTGANVAAYTNTGLTSGNKYYYRVRGYNAGGVSAYTNVASTAASSSAVTVKATKSSSSG